MSDEASDGWTRAAMVVGAVSWRDDAVLLVHEHNLGGEGPDQWVLPGGRVEPGELLDAAVRCQVEEETGIEFDIGEIVGVRNSALRTETLPTAPFLAFHVELAADVADRLCGTILTV